MQELYFYKELSVMHMLSGDTSGTISIDVEGSLADDARMTLVVSKVLAPDTALISKICTRSGNTFSVNISSSESQNLKGSYYMDFVLTTNGITYKRIRGLLEVDASPRVV